MAWCWCGSKRLPASGAIGCNLVARQRALQLQQRGLGPLAYLLRRGLLHRQPGFQAVKHRQQAFGKGFDGKFAHLAHLFVGAPAQVFHLGLAAQVLLGQFGILGLQARQLLRLLGLQVGGVSGRSGLGLFG